MPPPDLTRLLRPRSIAIVGATSRPGSLADNVFRARRWLGWDGEIHLVNPRHTQISERTCYPSLGALPAVPDCALFAINDSRLPDAFEDAAAAGVGAGVVLGRVYGTTPAGEPIAQRVRAIASAAGMTLCGGNCMGYVNLRDGLQITGMPFRSLARPDGIALISHSGSTWSGLVGNGRQLGIDFAVSAGQELVTNMGDYLDFMLDQPGIRAVACVIETLRDPEKFLAAADRADRMGIAVIALKLGRSDVARRFAISHSGAISSTAAAYDTVFRRHNIIQVRTLDEMLDTLELFRGVRRPEVPGLALGTDSGGERQLIVDIAADIGLSFADLGPATLGELQTLLDPGMQAANPLDYWGDGSNVIRPCLATMARDPSVGMVVMASNLPAGRDFSRDCAVAVIAVHNECSKPVALLGNIATTMSPEEVASVRAAGIPVLMGTEGGLRAIGHFLDHSVRKGPCAVRRHMPCEAAARWRETLLSTAAHPPGSGAGFALLHDYGIATTPFATVPDPAALASFVREVGFPIVLKIDDPSIPHKSDVGGVALNLTSVEAAEAAFHTLLERHPGTRLLAQKQAQGQELILGMVRDRDFGPLLTVGLGGIHAEVLRDVVLLPVPVDRAGALESLRSLRAFPLLSGARSQTPADLDAVADAIVALSRLALDLGDTITEIEINPLIAGPSGAIAVDCLINLEKAPSHAE
jgi:acetate---CoA ligase (ADP-forming)